MFRNNTVFVLGAGANWHYGYPTGDGLVGDVVKMADRLARYCDWRLKSGYQLNCIPEYVAQSGHDGWTRVRDECQLLSSRLKAVRPLLIDYFLAWNESLRSIGKLIIAGVILDCEAQWLREGANQKHRLIILNSPKSAPGDEERVDIAKYHDDWYRFIVHKLVYGCTDSAGLLKNKVRFITFNYDSSLEYNLSQALRAIDLLNDADVEKFLIADRIVHVYGSVHQGMPLSNSIKCDFSMERALSESSDYLQETAAVLNICFTSSESLRTIDPHDKEDDKTSLGQAQQWLSDAGVVYILGYGFDENNNRRIGLERALRTSENSNKTVMFTNFGDLKTINKKASKLFYGTYEKFLGPALHQGHPKLGNYFEKSVRTVYEALEQDFDALESEFIATMSS
ncbi:MAG TPA: hypothetical protein VIE66_13400 [Methylocella sp.]|jgi:hypothetical protein